MGLNMIDDGSPQEKRSSWMRVLGYGGLIPFLGIALGAWVNHPLAPARELAQLNLLYGVAIVSFLGAVHWGLALMISRLAHAELLTGMTAAEFETRSFVWGVTPSLLAWVTSAFAPVDLALSLLAMTLILVWWVDQQLLGRLNGFADYLTLRGHLTVGACIGLLATALAL